MQYFGGGHGPIPPGSIGFGGPIVTASGLAFIAGTFDPYIRAFEVETGNELWKAQLPASGSATPMTYSLKGRQYLVIAAGGHPKITEEAQSLSLIHISRLYGYFSNRRIVKEHPRALPHKSHNFADHGQPGVGVSQ